jgi:hypothetical protein
VTGPVAGVGAMNLSCRGHVHINCSCVQSIIFQVICLACKRRYDIKIETFNLNLAGSKSGSH